MECENKLTFCEWFDPNKIRHIRAYKVLQETGDWPIGFVPENIYMEPGWQAIIAFKIANEWIDYMLSGDDQ